jgi:hypothetical protein
MNAMEKLKRFPQNGFKEYLQHVHIRWQKYIIAQVDSFQAIAVDMIVFLSISRGKRKWFREYIEATVCTFFKQRSHKFRLYVLQYHKAL